MANVVTKVLLHDIRIGRLDVVTRIIDIHGLSYAREWSGGYVLLREAVKTKQTKIAKMLLTRGAEINPRTKRVGYTPLHHAIKNNDTQMVIILLEKGANPNTKGETGATPLHAAIFVGNLKIVKFLLNHNAHVDMKDRSGDTPVEYAIRQRNTKIVNALLKKGANINPKSSFVGSALHFAITEGEESVVKSLLNQGVDVNFTLSLPLRAGYTPLHQACAEGRNNIVELLLSGGANVNAKTAEKYTALHVAMQNERDHIVELLLEHKNIDVKARDHCGKTILHAAFEKGNTHIIVTILEFSPKDDDMRDETYLRDALYMYCQHNDEIRKIIAILLTRGCVVFPEDAKDSKFLHSTVEKGCLKILKDLLKFGADINTIHPRIEGKTLLHTAAENKEFEIVQLLINNGANVNAKYHDGRLPIWHAIRNVDVNMVKLFLSSGTDTNQHDLLHVAAREESKEIVEILLEHDPKIDINARDDNGCTPLHCAITAHNTYDESGPCNNPYIKIYLVTLLLSLGAEVNVQTKDGKTPLYAAVAGGYHKTVEILLANNADVNISTESSMNSPLHCSALGRNEEIVEMLLDNGAQIEKKNMDGKTPFNIAVSYDNEITVSVFLKYGADVDSRGNNGSTPLQSAVDNNLLKMVEILLDNFVDVEIRGENGMTPLHVASKRGAPKIVQELLDYGANINVICQNGHTPLHYAGRFYNNRYVDEHDYDSDYYDYYGNRRRRPNGWENFYYRHCDDDDSNPARYDAVVKILEQHIVKIRGLDLYVDKWNSDMVDRSPENKSFYEKCKNEIDPMKNRKINDTNVSYYDLLTKSVNQLAMYARNEKIVETLESNDYDEIFPSYCSMIRNNFKKGQKRENLLNSSLKSLNFLSEFSLPSPWSLQLLSNLSNKDLVSLTKAGPNEVRS